MRKEDEVERERASAIDRLFSFFQRGNAPSALFNLSHSLARSFVASFPRRLSLGNGAESFVLWRQCKDRTEKRREREEEAKKRSAVDEDRRRRRKREGAERRKGGKKKLKGSTFCSPEAGSSGPCLSPLFTLLPSGPTRPSPRGGERGAQGRGGGGKKREREGGKPKKKKNQHHAIAKERAERRRRRAAGRKGEEFFSLSLLAFAPGPLSLCSSCPRRL